MKKIEIKPNEITINEKGDLKVGDMLLKIDRKEYLEQPKYKSIMEIGNVKANNIKHSNWIQIKDVTIKDTYSYNSRFVKVLDEENFEIIVDKNTKVMYLQSTKGDPYRGYGGLTVMVDAEGKPLLWKE